MGAECNGLMERSIKNPLRYGLRSVKLQLPISTLKYFRKCSVMPKQWNWQQVRKFLGHFGLLATVTVYVAAGALIFRHLEHPAEEERLSSLVANLQGQKELFMSWHVCRDEPKQCTVLLEKLSDAVYRACKGGVPFPLNDSSKVSSKWTFPQAAFFATTILTTIGYGNVVPETFSGRLFCIMFALIGIPLTLTVIADMGVLLATAVSMVHKKFVLWFRVRNGLNLAPTKRRWISAVVGIGFLIVYLAAGAVLFMLLEDGWGFFEGFYFCFITMTTIGFGDLVPGTNQYMAMCTLYILIGLSLTSTIIELVRRQYAQSWKTIQALSGPLAESLKRLGECGTGIDVSLIHGDLRKLLFMMSTPVKAGSAEEWQAAVDNVLKDIELKKKKPLPVIQIIVYESSV